jgi:hypothetical protein
VDLMAIRAADYGVSASVGGETNAPALEAATEAARQARTEVQLPAGVIRVVSRPGSGAGFGMKFTLGDVTWLEDPSAGTTIYHEGDALGVRNHLIEIYGGSNYIFGSGKPGGLKFDGGGVQNPFQDQNHLFDVGVVNGPINNLQFRGVHFLNAGSGYQGAGTGDAVRLVGGATDKIFGTTFEGCYFENNGRSAISPNRGTEQLLIRNCEFLLNSDQDIDIESSSLAPIRGMRIIKCKFHANQTPGGPNISLGGAVDQLIYDTLIEDCIFDGAPAIQGSLISGLTVRRCTMSPNKAASGNGTVNLFGLTEDVLIEGCTIYHWAEMGAIPAAFFYNAASGNPTGIRIIDTNIYQYAARHCVELTACDEVEIEGGSINYLGAVTGTSSAEINGIWSRNLNRNVTQFSVEDTNIVGNPDHNLYAAVGINADVNFTFGGIEVDNVGAENATWGLVTNGVKTNYSGNPEFRGTRFGTGVGNIGQNSVNTPTVVTAGDAQNLFVVRALDGWGDPNGVEMGIVGDRYHRRSNGQEYLKSTGVPDLPTNTGWTAV